MSPGTLKHDAPRDRKSEHIRLALEPRMQMRHNYFEDYRFEHCALPELDLDEVDVSSTFLDKPLRAPILISCMTGGTDEAERINRNLAGAAEHTGVAVGVGSQRKAIEDPAMAPTFQVRPVAPKAPLLGNLGAVQLNYGFDVDTCRRAVEMIDADALVLHLNALQEALQPEGQCNFKHLLAKIGEVVRELEVPVIVKEVGSGVSAATGRRLTEIGVRYVDAAGTGGTSWARIEAARADDIPTGELFADWGIPTPESIRQLRSVPELSVIGSGGVRNGIDVAKSIALGADVVGLAYPFLAAATESEEKVIERVDSIVRELKISMFCAGAANLAALRDVPLLPREIWR